MNIHLRDILDPWELQEMVTQGYVKVQTHPEYPYNIACYTKQAMFDRKWNDVTLNCRGLIWHSRTGEVLARPFKKFFNYGEPNCPTIDPHEFVQVYDKVDGSLGIVYTTPNGPQIATKGSFTSDQALHASKLLESVYVDYRAVEGITDLFEIVYPENRIVLDYKDRDELVYLGSVGIASGDSYYRDMLKMPHAERGSFGEFSKVLPIYLDMKRPNAEGVVIHAEQSDIRVKVKQEDYIELHKVMTGLNERQIWEWMSEGKYLSDILPNLPEELHKWVTEVYNQITHEFFFLKGQVVAAHQESKHYDRKEFALFNAGKPSWMKGALFARYDGNYPREEEIVWKQVKP